MLREIKNALMNKLTAEVTTYLLAGVATTAVNLVVYFVFKNFCSPTVSNIIAWVVSVIFAYVVNSRFVFKTKSDTFFAEIKMFSEFVFARLTSGVIEVLGVFVFVEKLMINDVIIKIALSIFVIVFNYVVSKLWIFHKENETK